MTRQELAERMAVDGALDFIGEVKAAFELPAVHVRARYGASGYRWREGPTFEAHPAPPPRECKVRRKRCAEVCPGCSR